MRILNFCFNLMGVGPVKPVSYYLIVITFFIAGGTIFVMMKPNQQSVDPQNTGLKYRVYYDEPTASILEEMQELDVIILEPHHYTRDQIETIRGGGTVVYGYINMMEIDTWNESVVNEVTDEDFFYRNGEKIYFSEWNTYLADFTSSHYRDLIWAEIGGEIIDKQLDGIFMDTVGDIDDQHSSYPEVMREQQLAMTEFIKRIRSSYPDKKLIQNWGFDTLRNYTNPYVDGVMWESFHYSEISSDAWSRRQIRLLKQLQAKNGLEVYTISFREGEESKSYAEEYGFFHLHTREDYQTW